MEIKDEIQIIEELCQAMWDALKILGSDTDGDPNPAAVIAGMGTDGFVQYFMQEIRGHRRDHDEALESMFNSNLSSGKSVTLEFPNGTPTIERKET